jgi:hypothetical protein
MRVGTGFQTLAGVDCYRQRGGHRLVAAGTAVELDGAAITDLRHAVMHDGCVRTERGGEQ